MATKNKTDKMGFCEKCGYHISNPLHEERCLLVSNPMNPKHYNQFKIQVMEFCEVNKFGWCESNVIKYVVRHEGKNGLEDLRKALEYLKCLIYYKETGKFLTPDKIKKLKRSWR